MLGLSYRHKGNLSGAETAFRRSVDILARIFGPQSPRVQSHRPRLRPC
jgi:hypothetical protein